MDRLTERPKRSLERRCSLEQPVNPCEVKEELQKGLKLNTDMTGQMVELTSKFADRAREDRVNELNSRAVSHFSMGEYTQARELLTRRWRSPREPGAPLQLGHVLAAMGDLKDAEERFRKALAESPELEPAIPLGMIMVKTDRPGEQSSS